MDGEMFFRIINSSERAVNAILHQVDIYYTEKREEKIDKRTGEPRRDKDGNIIYRRLFPCRGSLEKIQGLIQNQILGVITYPEYVQGGVKGRSYATNARMHMGKRYKLHTDIQSFFPSISYEMVYLALRRQGFRKPVAKLITKLATYKGFVPQGTRTATSLANLVFFHFADQKIYSLCKIHNITYTRFVDDIFCSSPTDFKPLIPEILALITEPGFSISPNKTGYGTSPIIITGVLTKNNVLDVPEDWGQKVNDPNRSEKSRQGLINHRKYVRKVSKRKKG